ncbi:MAG: hypothetical protein JSW04_08470 [Desulfobacterales bacterium]|nr:MAG: hypothetical protein JSW04_08470 [Desulfobacterales bacterium]
MKTILLSIGQLTLVAIVYYCAYKKGYEAALEKTMGLIKEVSGPVHDLFEKLNQSAEEKAINK